MRSSGYLSRRRRRRRRRRRERRRLSERHIHIINFLAFRVYCVVIIKTHTMCNARKQRYYFLPFQPAIDDVLKIAILISSSALGTDLGLLTRAYVQNRNFFQRNFKWFQYIDLIDINSSLRANHLLQLHVDSAHCHIEKNLRSARRFTRTRTKET